MKLRFTYTIDVDMGYDDLDDAISEFNQFKDEHGIDETILALICNLDLDADIECTSIEEV